MKKFMKVAFVAIFAAIAGYGVYTSQKVDVMSELALANVEALASGEIGNGENQCYQVYTPADWFHSDQIFVDCYTCTQKKGRNFDISRSCFRN
ncbi:NVEALA domain-containing protein [Bacteroides sp. MSB163]|jgi:hypothetical protein|uniref:NVEALA domain-containing protein n=1 Tax=Bacteroides maternus TaxID=3117552 RepID=UPI002633E9B5|nr:NVEALA domain-containing protein [uncultured Bacteroides sp.]